MALRPRQREQIADQVLTVLEQLYVSRQMKTALHGVDVSALLRGIRTRAAATTDLEFHRAIRDALIQLRDRHVTYIYDADGEFFLYSLPFTVERAFDGEAPIYLVNSSGDKKTLPEGSVVVNWNGVPIDFVVRELSTHVGAATEAARMSLACEGLSHRYGMTLARPIEVEVRLDVTLPEGEEREVKFAWKSESYRDDFVAFQSGNPAGLGVDRDRLVMEHWRFKTFQKDKFEAAEARDYGNIKTKTVEHKGVAYGYLRIFNFAVDDAHDFANYVASCLKDLPPNGLIIDLRGNSGGIIAAGELLLQMFTNSRIQPLLFRFRASDAIDYFMENSDRFKAWAPTVAQACRIGAEHSAGFPILDSEDDYNRIGRIYPGPSLLIVDAKTYSTGDMFTAGYQDHAIGPVMCCDENTSAAGANNWYYDDLRSGCFPGFLLPVATTADLDRGIVGAEVRDAFASNGHPLAADATLVGPGKNGSDRYWALTSQSLKYIIFEQTWLRRDLAVQFDGDNRFVANLPGVRFGFSLRQAVRRMRSNGLLLEDDGIAPDHLYRMTRRDVLSENVDMLTFACDLLAHAASIPAGTPLPT